MHPKALPIFFQLCFEPIAQLAVIQPTNFPDLISYQVFKMIYDVSQLYLHLTKHKDFR